MLDRKSQSWFYPQPTGDPGRDRNARTLQVACFLLASAITAVAALSFVTGEPREAPVLYFTVAGLAVAAVMNRAGRWEWALRIAVLAVLLTAILLVFEARDGFRSHAMLIFPALLFISVMFLDRPSYAATAGIVLAAVAALGIAEKHALLRPTLAVRTPTSYASIVFVDLQLLVIAIIGSRIARDNQKNVFDLRSVIDQLCAANLELTRTHEAQRESEERFRSLFENATVGIYRTTPSGRIDMGNPALVRMLGYESFAALADRNLEKSGFEPEYRRSAFRESLERHGQIKGLEAVWTRQDGSRLFVRESARCIRDEMGAVRFYEGIVEDITERKRAEEELRTSERKFATAFRASPASVSIVDIDNGNRMLDVNEAFERTSGYSRDDLIGQKSLELGIWPELEEYMEALTKFRSYGRLRNFEFHFRRKNGEIGIGLTSAEPIEISDHRCAITCTIDITERKRAEAALRESEERFRKVFEEGPLGLALVQKDYRFLKVNRALCEMVGYTEAELVGKSFADITYSDDLQADVELAEQLFSGGLPFYRLQKRYVKKTGEIIWINLTGSVIHDDQNQPLYGIAMIVDVTEMKRAQEEAFARQKLESVGILANGIAHDFNNLLGGIRAQAELAAAELAAGESPLESIHTITNVTSRGAEIVRELMIYAGHDTPGPLETVDLPRLIEEMLELFKISISKHVVLETDLSNDVPAVLGRASQLHQIVMNLIINASEAIGEKSGSIRVAVSRTILPGDRTLAGPARLPAGEYLKLEVSDTGVGMTEEMQAKVFDPFFSTKFAGRGLGLAVVHGLVRDLNGSITIVSEPGQGSTFQILLPGAATTARTTPPGPF